MRRITPAVLGLSAVLALSACDKLKKPAVEKGLDPVNVIDATNLNDVMLTVADPNEAVAYFQRALKQEPERMEFRRGLAKSLVKAGRATEAVPVFETIVNDKDATWEDRIDYADALIRTGDWKAAKAQLDKVPPTHETYKRYRLEAMIADSRKEWKKADSFYETAAGMTTRPAGVLNNWGYSKLTRGDYAGAEKLFIQAISADPGLFTAKNNLILARAAQKKYTLPLIEMTQVEKAKLLYGLGLAAVRQGDVEIGRSLLQQAIDTHPQHFAAAVRALEALDRGA